MPDTQEMHVDYKETSSYQNKLKSNRKYLHKRYHTDAEWRRSEIERNKKRVGEAYKNDPILREKMKQNAWERYYRLKEEKRAAAAKGT
jgi:hypothetical protein